MKLNTTLSQLETAQLVRRVGEEQASYIFKHALTQDTAYESLLKQTRRTIHHHVAESIVQIYPERLDDYAALLAQHYAEAGDDAKTAEYAVRAGDVATRIFAYPEARAHYAIALDAIAHLPDDEDNRRRHADALIKQVTVALRSAGPAETLKRLSQAELLAQPFAERPDASREDRVRLARVHFWQGHALLHHGDARASLEKMRAVMTIAQADNEPPLLAISASVIGRSLAVQGQFAQAISILSDAITALEQTHDEHEWIFSVGLRGFCLAMRGDVARGIAEAERTLVRANEVGTLTGISVSHFILALTYLFSDSIPAALEHARAVIETSARSGDRFHTFMGYGYLAWAQTEANLLEEAESSFAQMNSIVQAIGGRAAFRDAFMVARADLYFRCGEYARAISTVQEAIAISQASAGIFFPGLAHRLWARSLAKSPAVDWGEVENHLSESMHLLEECDAQIEIARTQVAWGKILIERSKDDAANRLHTREHFDKAIHQFQLSGLIRELNETRALLTHLSFRGAERLEIPSKIEISRNDTA